MQSLRIPTGWWERPRRVAGRRALPTTPAASLAHTDALGLLEDFSFGFDGGRDDKLHALQLAQIGGAHAAHAGAQCTHQILRAIVQAGGTEKDFFERLVTKMAQKQFE